MTAVRNRTATKNYEQWLKAESADTCEFCKIVKGHPQFVSQTRYFKVIRNRFGYSLWDDHTVADHLMVLPRKHIQSMAELPSTQAAAFLQLISKYEANGYSMYLRAVQNPSRTVMHQHTHLIKSEGTRKQFLLFMRRPYMRIVR